MRPLALALSLLLASCAGVGARSVSRPLAFAAPTDRRVVTDEECVRWLSARRTWGAVAIGAAAASGAGGATTALFDGGDTPRIAVGLTTLVLGAFAALAGGLDRGYADDFAHHCTVAPSTTPP